MMLGPCLSTGPPDPGVSREMIQLIDRSLDAVQEEVAASRSSSFGPLLLFLASILLPLAGAFWLVAQARKSAIQQESVIRSMVEAGLSRQLIDSYVNEQKARPQLPGPATNTAGLPTTERHGRQPRRWRRRKRRRP